MEACHSLAADLPASAYWWLSTENLQWCMKGWSRALWREKGLCIQSSAWPFVVWWKTVCLVFRRKYVKIILRTLIFVSTWNKCRLGRSTLAVCWEAAASVEDWGASTSYSFLKTKVNFFLCLFRTQRMICHSPLFAGNILFLMLMLIKKPKHEDSVMQTQSCLEFSPDFTFSAQDCSQSQ